ncbi:MAG: SCO family protein [Pyrinomonadaceae bacterium]
MKFMRQSFVFLLVLLFLSACGTNPANNGSPLAKRYPLKGKVVSVDRGAKKATIDHEPVADYMPAMTMDFPIRADWVWDDLTPGSEIRAELVVDNTADEPYWLENIGIVAALKPGQEPPPTDERFAQIGKDAPDFVLTDQDGKKITMGDFRGKALAITFIYARCPLADYCIRMSTNFSDLALQLNNNAELRDKIRLLSISFDPENDTPAKLRSYGLGYMGKGATTLGVWQLAVGADKQVRALADFYGLRYEVDQNDRTQFNHSLRTIVISPEGKVTKILAGNEWTPVTLKQELERALVETK